MRLSPLVAVLVAAAFASVSPAGMLRNDGNSAFIQVQSWIVPSVFAGGGADDFSIFVWLRREANPAGGVQRVLRLGNVLRIEIDDDLDLVQVAMDGTPTLTAEVPLRGGDGNVPSDAWMLIAASFDTDGGLTAWAAAESLDMETASDPTTTWSGGVCWPPRLGADDPLPGINGILGLVAIRNHTVTTSDVMNVWNGGTPHYFTPLRSLDGAFAGGFHDVVWATSHGVVTNPRRTVNPFGTGAELGDTAGPNNIPIYHDFDPTTYYNCSRINSIGGEWTFVSPHTADEAWSGFFVRETPDIVAGTPWVGRVSPLANALATNDPNGLIRVMVTANSRAVRLTRSYGRLENWQAGLFDARQDSIAGVTIAAPTCDCTNWPAFAGSGYRSGSITDAVDETTPMVSFGNFGSHGAGNSAFPDYALNGNAIILRDGAEFVPKARPEPGTLIESAATPLTVRALVLQFPGSGDVLVQGEQATAQDVAGTPAGTPTTLALDTTLTTYTLAPADVVDAVAGTIEITAPLPDVAPGDACFIESGPGAGGIGVIRDRSGNTIEFAGWFPESPAAGTSTLRFGPIATTWATHEWSGLATGDPETWRGLSLTAQGGPVVVLFLECFRPGADGFVLGAFGRSGRGYEQQLQMLFDGAGLACMESLAPDVMLQFFAHQGSDESIMIDWTNAVRDRAPDVETWWCGDPDLDARFDGQIEGTDSWQAFILDNAAANDVGAIVGQEHPTIGTGNERAIDGQVADKAHLSGRGAALYVAAILDYLADAAEPGIDACPEDVDGDGAVGFNDLVAVLAAWGPCSPACAEDIDEDGTVGFNDVVALLAAWGSCKG